MTAGVSGLGVCYYPEQWPKALWREDAARMAGLGLRFVRIGEFAWSRIEPDSGRFDWAWLDEAVETIAGAGLKIIFGTPTATPPKWLVDAYPDILPWDRDGRPRRFGSRRHYCFSSETYRRETARIVAAVAGRYGAHKAVAAWQTDNEYGCHDTVRSYSPAAARAFRRWLEARYGAVEALNAAWGTAFWSQDYRSFAEVDLPHLTVTEANPAHALDFCRFSSDQVASYHRLQAEILRKASPGRPILHNFMGFFTDFDHFAVGADCDAASWDSYPLGFLDVGPFAPADKARYLRQGHPDLAAFHHDLYRRCGKGHWLVMEQQPGPVNWAHHNPEPSAGMVRLWTQEAFAHGASAVSYFRWRQAPFAQEQMHAGLLRPDSAPAPAFSEAEAVLRDGAPIEAPAQPGKAKAALVFSYEAKWVFDIQPQGRAFDYWRLVLQSYGALRRLGLDVDILAPDDSFEGYGLVLVPPLPILPEGFVERARASTAQFIFGPRTGSKTPDFQIPAGLAPGALKALLPLTVIRSESFPPDHREAGEGLGGAVSAGVWLDHVETALDPMARTKDGAGLVYAQDRFVYCASVLDDSAFGRLVAERAQAADLVTAPLPPDLRLRRRNGLVYAFNYGSDAVAVPAEACPPDAEFLTGGRLLAPSGVAIWKSSRGA